MGYIIENPPVAAATIATVMNGFIILGSNWIITTRNNNLIFKREKQRWTTEKIYETYEKATRNFSELIQSASASGEISKSYYQLINSLSDLKVVCSQEEVKGIENIKFNVESLYQGKLIQSNQLGQLEIYREQLVDLMKNNKKIEGLFRR